MFFIREDMASITVNVNGIPFGGSWAEAEGGNLEADDAKARPGGMGREVSAGGPASRDDLTVRTHMTDVVATWVPTLESAVGNPGLVGAPSMLVNIAWMTPNRQPSGSGVTRTGTLKAVNVPDMGTGADAGMLELVMSCDE